MSPMAGAKGASKKFSSAAAREGCPAPGAGDLPGSDTRQHAASRSAQVAGARDVVRACAPPLAMQTRHWLLSQPWHSESGDTHARETSRASHEVEERRQGGESCGEDSFLRTPNCDSLEGPVAVRPRTCLGMPSFCKSPPVVHSRATCAAVPVASCRPTHDLALCGSGRDTA